MPCFTHPRLQLPLITNPSSPHSELTIRVLSSPRDPAKWPESMEGPVTSRQPEKNKKEKEEKKEGGKEGERKGKREGGKKASCLKNL